MKNKTSSGLDEISNTILKKIVTVIVIPLVHILNLSFMQGKFPEALKTSKVIPLFKKGNKQNIENYRPLALTSNIAKLYEKLFVTRLNSFVNLHNIIVKEQYGFQKGKDTSDAIANGMEIISRALDRRSWAFSLTCPRLSIA